MVQLNQIAAATSYALTSVLLLISNKSILSTYSFRYPFIMSLSHMVVGLLFLQILRRLGFITFAAFDWSLAKKAFPVSLCFILNCVLGMVALRGTNIPMFSTLRRLSVLMVMVCEFIVLHKRPTKFTAAAVSVMVLGSFIGGWADLQFDAVGYMMVMLNNLVTALNLVFLKKTLTDTQLASDTFGVLYYNSLLSIPFLMLFALVTGELSLFKEFPYLWDTGFQSSFLLSAVVSFGMNYSTYWCTEVNSALTTSVTGQVKNVMSSLVSLLLTSRTVGVKPTPMLITGLSVGLMGSFMYAYAASKQQAQAKAVTAMTKIQIQVQEANSANQPEHDIEMDEHATLLVPSIPLDSSASTSAAPSPDASPCNTPLVGVGRELLDKTVVRHGMAQHGGRDKFTQPNHAK